MFFGTRKRKDKTKSMSLERSDRCSDTRHNHSNKHEAEVESSLHHRGKPSERSRAPYNAECVMAPATDEEKNVQQEDVKRLEFLTDKLKGQRSPLGKFAIPIFVLLGVWKVLLGIVGILALSNVPDLLRYVPVAMPLGRTATGYYLVLQIFDALKDIIQADSGTVSHVMHHFVTSAVALPVYIMGSDRTVAITTMFLLSELVNVASPVTHVLRHVQRAHGRLNLYASSASALITILIRMPLWIFCIWLCSLDCYSYVFFKERLEESADIQLHFMPPLFAGLGFILVLDAYWLQKRWTNIKGIKEVLRLSDLVRHSTQGES